MAWQTEDTVDLEIAAWSPSASARVASTSRTDRPRMKEAITRDSRALVLVTWLPNRREANASVVPRSFGRARRAGPGADPEGTPPHSQLTSTTAPLLPLHKKKNPTTPP